MEYFDINVIYSFILKNMEKTIEILTLIGFMFFLIRKNSDKRINKKELDECIYYLYRRIPKRRSDYIPDQKILEQFYNNPLDEKTLYIFAKHIILHCGLKPAALQVKVKEKADNNEAGLYKIFGNASTIEIVARPGANKNEILATLIHECMHFYLRARGAVMQDKQKNEYMTDIATIYFGFYKYMKAGYGHVGYLGKGDLKYVYNKINSLE